MMEKYFRRQLHIWTYDKIKSSPKKFGGDNSNALVMYEYLQEFYGGKNISNLEPYTMSVLATISRIKNKILKKNPHFDHRDKHKPKGK